MEFPKITLEHLLNRVVHYRKEVALGVVVAAATGLAVGGYVIHKNYIAQKAHKAYVRALQLQQAPVLKEGEFPQDGLPGSKGMTFASSTEKWEAVARAFGAVYADYGHAGIGAMAGAAQAQALIRLGNYDEARGLLASVVHKISSPELRALYTLTYARMLLDSPNEDDQQKGRAQLIQLAATKDSAVHDSALYYLGLQYWMLGDVEAAANYWRQLVMQYPEVGQKSSPWTAKAEERLALITHADDAANE